MPSKLVSAAVLCLTLCLLKSVPVSAGENWKWIAPPVYTLPESSAMSGESLIFTEGLARIGQDGKWGYIDESGKVVIPIIFERAGDFSGNLALTSVNGRTYGLIRYLGGPAGGEQNGAAGRCWEWVTEPSFYLAESTLNKPSAHNENLSRVKQGGKWGYIDSDMEVVIPFIFENAGGFSGDMALASLDGVTYGFIRYTKRDGADGVQTAAAPSTVLLYNGALVSLTKPPIERNGADFYPLEDILQAAGGGYQWNGNDRTISGRLNDNDVAVSLADMRYVINGAVLEAPETNAPFIENDRVYVNLGYIMENTGLSVEWDSESARTISIK